MGGRYAIHHVELGELTGPADGADEKLAALEAHLLVWSSNLSASVSTAVPAPADGESTVTAVKECLSEVHRLRERLGHLREDMPKIMRRAEDLGLRPL